MSGLWIVGLIGDGVEQEVLPPTTFDSMNETLAGLGVRRVDDLGWEVWNDGLRAEVEFLI